VEKRQYLHWGWIILGTCFINLFINYSVRLGYGVVLPEMIRTLGFSRADSAAIFNSYLFVYIALTPLTGYLTDRFGARCVITVCTLFLGTGVVLMGTVQSLWTACLFFAIVGLGATGIYNHAFAINVLMAALGLMFICMVRETDIFHKTK